MIPAELPLAHLSALTDGRGLFEHARGDVPRRELGYCTDDVARALAVTAREDGRADAAALADRYLRFVEAAVAGDGRVRNRMSPEGRWTDQPDTGDWWGRALWGLGAAARFSARASVRERAAEAFRRAAQARSPWLHAACFAALGAIEVWEAQPDAAAGAAASRVLRDAADTIMSLPAGAGATRWPWPEDRLRYANGAIPEALIAAGRALEDDRSLARGLELLGFLVDRETAPDGHLSPTPVGGRGPGDAAPGFDQQPIEAATLAHACLRAWEVTGDERWASLVRTAWGWFEGDNDVGVALFDPATGAGYDGLTPTGRNDNRGAESTLAALATLQCLHRVTAPVA